MPTINVPDVTVILKHETCCNCGTHFAMDSVIMEKRQQDKESFYCPNGHGMAYTGTNLEKLKEELEQARRDAQTARSRATWAEQNLQSEKYSHAATKGKLTKTEKRIAHGVCPCCNRSFTDVRRHMDSKHPDYGGQVKKAPSLPKAKPVVQPLQKNIMHFWGGKEVMKLQNCNLCGKLTKDIESHYKTNHPENK